MVAAIAAIGAEEVASGRIFSKSAANFLEDSVKMATLGNMSFSGKVAIVTGAGRGIGEAIAKRFADAGAKVAVVSRTEANSQKVADAINAQHAEAAKGYAVDVSDFESVQALGEQIIKDFGKVDILVNNAGVTRDNLSMRMSPEDWDLVLDTNLKGAFNFIRAVIRPMVKQRCGRIINVGSVVGLIGNAGQANYAASKAGLIGLTKSMAREFASRNITANVIAPGFIETDMTAVLSDDVKKAAVGQVPLGRMGKADEIAAAVTFLASDEAAYITGQTLAVDGGMVMS